MYLKTYDEVLQITLVNKLGSDLFLGATSFTILTNLFIIGSFEPKKDYLFSSVIFLRVRERERCIYIY